MDCKNIKFNQCKDLLGKNCIVLLGIQHNVSSYTKHNIAYTLQKNKVISHDNLIEGLYFIEDNVIGESGRHDMVVVLKQPVRINLLYDVISLKEFMHCYSTDYLSGDMHGQKGFISF